MKKGTGGLRGIDKVVSNLNKELAKKKVTSMKGLLLAAAFIRRDMEATPPLIPVGDSGNLRSSWFVTPGYVQGLPYVKMGFTASYALLVHERVGNNINWSRPNSGPKFLESAVKRNKVTLLRIIANGML